MEEQNFNIALAVGFGLDGLSLGVSYNPKNIYQGR